MLRTTALVSLSALAILTAAGAQERVKKEQPEDFPALLSQASEAWTGENYGACTTALRKAMGLVAGKRREAILAAFPAPAEGWERESKEVDEAAAAMVAGFAGTVVDARYRGPDGQNVSVQAMVDSPMVQMVSMMMSNPNLLGEGKELIKYGDHSAILEDQGNDRFKLTIVVDDDVIQVDARGISDDELLKMMSQDVIDGLAVAMAN